MQQRTQIMLGVLWAVLFAAAFGVDFSVLAKRDNQKLGNKLFHFLVAQLAGVLLSKCVVCFVRILFPRNPTPSTPRSEERRKAKKIMCWVIAFFLVAVYELAKYFSLKAKSELAGGIVEMLFTAAMTFFCNEFFVWWDQHHPMDETSEKKWAFVALLVIMLVFVYGGLTCIFLGVPLIVDLVVPIPMSFLLSFANHTLSKIALRHLEESELWAMFTPSTRNGAHRGRQIAVMAFSDEQQIRVPVGSQETCRWWPFSHSQTRAEPQTRRSQATPLVIFVGNPPRLTLQRTISSDTDQAYLSGLDTVADQSPRTYVFDSAHNSPLVSPVRTVHESPRTSMFSDSDVELMALGQAHRVSSQPKIFDPEA